MSWSLSRLSLGERSGTSSSCFQMFPQILDWIQVYTLSGHSNSWMCFVLNHSILDFALCFRSVSCWKENLRPSLRSVTESKRFSLKMAPSIFPSTQSIFPFPAEESQPLTMMMPECSWAFWLHLCSLLSSFGLQLYRDSLQWSHSLTFSIWLIEQCSTRSLKLMRSFHILILLPHNFILAVCAPNRLWTDHSDHRRAGAFIWRLDYTEVDSIHHHQ